MPTKRFVQYEIAAVLATVLAMGALVLKTVESGASAPAASHPVTHRLSSRVAGGDVLDQNAWDEFVSLVHPSSQLKSHEKIKPEWLSWKNKCQVLLLNSCTGHSGRTNSDLRGDELSAEIPRQVLLNFKRAKLHGFDSDFVQSYLHSPEIAAVLFNSKASDSILANNLGRRSQLDLAIGQLDAAGVMGAERRLPPTTFEDGSEIVKLVWEIVPANKSLVLFDKDAQLSSDDGNSLLPLAAWGSRYSLDVNSNQRCPPKLSQSTADAPTPSVPINCFYWFEIRGQSCKSLSWEVTKTWCTPPAAGRPFYAVLVGFHVMKLVSTNPDWLWMTYFWTVEKNDGETGADGPWAAPWNHFHEFSTTAIREMAPADHELCFNPYLEGPFENGTKANCLSCHSLAAYAPSPGKPSEGVHLGFSYPFPLTQRAQTEPAYFAGAVQTGFVWSISTNQDTESHELLQSFQSDLQIAIDNQLK